jgi:DNA-binding response OmpR family regulator
VWVRDTVRGYLERDGYEVVVASDGNEGMQALAARLADLVITDLFMPGKEGIETIREIRQAYPSIRIIAISERYRSDTSHLLQVAEKLGADKTLCKPFSREQLATAVKVLLSRQIDMRQGRN